MAAHKIGKFKFSLSKDGFAWRWGEGEIKRFSFDTLNPKKFGKKDDDYTDYEDDDQPGRYYDEADDGSGAYDDGHYADYDGAAGDSYEKNSRYAQDGSDPYYDDDENQNYPDDGYDYDYDDGHDYYEGEEYEEDPDDDDEYVEGNRYIDAALRYADENDWLTYALLVLVPPLGIYLLWRRNKFDLLMRAGITAVSALWFVTLIVLLIMSIRGTNDKTSGSNMQLLTPTPTLSTVVTATPVPSPSATTAAVSPSPSPTPIAGNTINDTDTATGYVYSPVTGIYYHSTDTCANIPSGVSVSRVTVATAENRGQSQCPLCYGETIYYATANGKYYHSDKTCSGMVDAQTYTKSAAEREGKSACPVCILKTQPSLDTNSNTGSSSAIAQFAQTISSDKSGIKVWATKGGQYFHTKSDCSGMSGASNITLLAAIQAGKTNCPVCAAAAGTLVYATESGKYYHSKSNCSGMENASSIPLALALVMGKTSCPVCISTTDAISSGGTTDTTSEIYVYATTNGQYYHTDSTCSGMSGASKITLKAALAAGKKACPVCAALGDTKVYATAGGKYFHSYATCSGMSGATEGTLAAALAYGLEACPVCWNTSGDGNDDTSNSDTTTTSGVNVYCTTNGKYYHTDSTCSGMSGASKVSLETAVKLGKTACPVCAAVADKTVYGTTNGKYFHYDSTCSGMTNAQSSTLATALLRGYAPCPVCVLNSKNEDTNNNSDTEGSGGFVAGTSGIKVYATTDGPYYHTSKSHAGSGAAYITLETALNYGKTACPQCASSAGITVYAVPGGTYYHITKAHAGSGAVAGTLGEALAAGLKPCPVCQEIVTGVTQTATDAPTDSGIFDSGASGIKVYATVDGKYFHTSKSHAGSGASYITLETALNYGKYPCPECASVAYVKVYASASDQYYHAVKSHAGSNAQEGYLAIAAAYGKKPCPICYGSSSGGDDGDNSGGATTPEYVYIDLDGDSNMSLYHSSSTCSGSGMLNGQKVTYSFAKEQGFTACPYCIG